MYQPQDDEVRVTFTIPAVNMPEFQARIDHLNRRAKRLGCSPITLQIAEPYVKELTQHIMLTGTETKSRKIKCRVFDVTVTGQSPKLPGGWHLAARVQLVDGATLLHTVPGHSVPAQYRQATNHCDHCRTVRTRHDVFVLRQPGATPDAAGRYICVGRNCIADFLGNVSPATLAWRAEALALLDCRDPESLGDGTGASWSNQFDVPAYVTAAAAAVRLWGFISVAAARLDERLTTTRSAAAEIMDGRAQHEGAKVTPTEEDAAKAEAALAWAAEIAEDTDSDYLANLRQVAQLTYGPNNLRGLAASIISAHERALGKAAVRAINAERNRESSYIGELGKRIDIVATVERIVDIETMYGPAAIHLFRDQFGNVLKWKASRERLQPGTVYAVRGTVKKHSTFREVAQTELSRCICNPAQQAAA